jgi:hypothetical protein
MIQFSLMGLIEGPPMGEAVPQTEAEAKPFLIRGHHLVNLAGLLQVNPTELSVAMLKDLRNPYPQDREYAHDVIGFPSDDEDSGDKRYFNGIKKYLTDFLELPDEHPVVIAARPDRICDSCAIGNHCRERGTKNDQAMRHFIDVVTRTGSGDEIEIREEDTTFTGSIVRSKIITTNAEIVRSALGEFTQFL